MNQRETEGEQKKETMNLIDEEMEKEEKKERENDEKEGVL